MFSILNNNPIWVKTHIIKMTCFKFTLKNVELKVVTVDGKPWTRAKEVCQALEYGDNSKTATIIKQLCSPENIAHKWELTKSSADDLMNWPKYDPRKDDYYINEEGMYEFLFKSQQPLAKECRQHCCNVMFPHIRKQLTDKMVEEHQTQIADKDDKIKAIEYENVELKMVAAKMGASIVAMVLYKQLLPICMELLT